MSHDDEGEYEVGYGTPPRYTQFRRGQFGNPRGRPSGSRDFSTLLREGLNERVVVKEKSGRRKITKRQAIAIQVVNQSLNGNLPATNLLIEMQQDNESRVEPETAESPFDSVDQKVIEQFMVRLNGKKESND